MRLLPRSLVNAAASIQWPLGPEATPPLHLTSLEKLRDTIRATDERASRFDFLQDLPATIEELFPLATTSSSCCCCSPEERHFGLISLALILLGNGWTDECHNLVTPLSWPDDIHFAYGPSIYSQVSPEARIYATYVHSLVHRREAFHTGEFGMMGFANANYWSNAFARSPVVVAGFPHADLCAAVQGRAASHAYHAPIQSWYQQHDFSNGYFEARAIHALCATVLQQQGENTDPILQSFAQDVAATEVRILLDHTLARAGFAPLPSSSLPQETPSPAARTTDPSIDSDTSTAAAQKVSSAHLDVYRSTGSIVLRRLARSNAATMAVSCKPLGPRRRFNARQPYLISLLLLGGAGSTDGLIGLTPDLRAPPSVSRSLGGSPRNGTSKRPRRCASPLFADADIFKETQGEDKRSSENLQLVGRKRQQRRKPRNRRPRHYWSDPNNFKAELEQFWSDCGVDPSNYPTLLIPNEGLLMHYGRHDLRAALSSAGGRPLVAELLDARIMPGRWQEAVQEEQIQALIQVNDSLSEDKSPSATASSSEDKWSHQSGRKPKGYWTLQRVVEGLYEYVDGVRKEHGRPAVWMPRPNELIASGRDDLRQAMERFGGTKRICQLAGMVPFREWYFFEGQLELLCGLKDYIDEHENSDYTKFPNASDIRRNGCEQLYSLIQYYGGRKYLAFRLGMNSGSILPTDDFVGVNWGPFDLVFAVSLLNFVREDHLRRPPPLTTPLLKMPRREKLQEEEVWLHEEVERYGGYENVARRLGLAFFD